jgi:predicted PurR-regulated permease PerM
LTRQSADTTRIVILVLLVLSLVLVVLTVRPFASALFMAAVLAVTFHPWYERLARRLNGRRVVAAAIIATGLVLALVIPVASLSVVAVRETADALEVAHDILGREGVEGLIRRLPQPIQARVDDLWQQLPRRERNAEFVFNLERRLATSIPHLVNVIGQIVLQTGLTIAAMFFLLLDGHRLIHWLDVVLPLKKTHVLELFSEFRRTSATVLLGSVVTAAVQAVLALIGYLITGVPNPHIAMFLTFFLGLIPLIGAGGVTFMAAIYLFLTGHLLAAIFLAVWAIGVVGLVDNFLKPALIKGGIELHGGVVFFALLGGITVFGPVGLILGPLSVTLLIAVLRIYQRDFAPRPEPAA